MICPKCRSHNTTVEMVQSSGKTKKYGIGLEGHLNNAARGIVGISTLGVSNLFWKKSKGSEKTSFKNQKVCICQNCGYNWNIK